MYKKIGDYGIIGNLHSAALVGLDGSIDWFCLPHLDSPSLFGALLDDERGGRFAVTPRQEYDSTASYLRETNVLVTRFRTRTGILRVIDFMPAGEEDDEESHRLYRLLEVEKGRVEVGMVFDPRFDYGREPTRLELRDGGIVARGGGESLALSCTHPLSIAERTGKGIWSLAEGEHLCLHLRYGANRPDGADPEETRRLLRETVVFWRRWLSRCEAGRLLEYGPHREMVVRSLLALKLLFYAPTGSIAAAATTSLPEEVGGERNWDYRYTWIRDASMTVDALWSLGYREEMRSYLRWIEKIIAGGDRQGLRIMYRLDGTPAPEEVTLPHWEGYKGSGPVRLGNEAVRQRQLGIYGHLMEGARRLADSREGVAPELWENLRNICDYVIGHWQEPDSSIWEMRDKPRHFLHTRLMCWVALQQGVTIARDHRLTADWEAWEKTREEIREEILSRGWSERRQSFVQAYGAEDLDASNLLIPMMGFLPFDDPRVLATMEAVRRELGKEGFVYRYLAVDGLKGGEGVFLFCTFWLIVNLARQGEIEEAEFLLRKAEETANHLALFSEEYDPEWKEQLGNTPQAFTHIGYLQAVGALDAARREEGSRGGGSGRILNQGKGADVSAHEIPGRVAGLVSELQRRVAADGRLDYDSLRESDLFPESLRLEKDLAVFDPRALQGRESQTAFWVNLHNLLVIRGVLALEIGRSVMEVGRFFREVRYRLGEFVFSPEEIAHGLLRGNRPPPGRLLPPFSPGDPKLSLVLRSLDPRIHFVLFHATTSSAHLFPLHADCLDRELDQAAAKLLGEGGWLRLDRDSRTLHLHRTFRWYAEDFGHSDGAGSRFLHPYLQEGEDREFLEKNAAVIRVRYLDYDWRLNADDIHRKDN